MSVVATALVDRYSNGGLETVAIVAAEADGPARIVGVHPDGERAMRVGTHDPTDDELAGGVSFVRWFAAEFASGTLSFTTETGEYPDIDGVPILRRSRSGTAFDAGERDVLVEKIRAAECSGSDDRWQVTAEYFSRIPYVPVARCPITGKVVYHAIDPFGTDGPWWGQADTTLAPPATIDPPSTFLLLGGVVGEVGARPAVSGSFLERPGVKAVIRSLRVGSVPVHMVAYFASRDVAVHAEWPARLGSHWQYDQHADGVASLPWLAEPEDTDVEGWIVQGKLQWIAPADPTLSLRDDAAGWRGAPGGRYATPTRCSSAGCLSESGQVGRGTTPPSGSRELPHRSTSAGSPESRVA